MSDLIDRLESKLQEPLEDLAERRLAHRQLLIVKFYEAHRKRIAAEQDLFQARMAVKRAEQARDEARKAEFELDLEIQDLTE